MAPVTDVHSYLPKLCLEHCVAGVALHIICRLCVTTKICIYSEHSSLPNLFQVHVKSHTNLIKVSNPGNMVLPALSQHIARVGDHHCCVPQSAVLLFSLQNWRNNDHVVFSGQLKTELQRYQACVL